MFLTTMLSDWKLALAGVMALVALAGWGAFAWERGDYRNLELQLANQKTAAQALLTEATNKLAGLQKTRDSLNLAIEDQHAKTEQALAAAADDNRHLAADIQRLQQSGRGTGGGHTLPAASHTAAGSAGSAASGDRLDRCEALLAEGTSLLSGTAERSDHGAQLAQELGRWSREVAGLGLPAERSDR